MFGNKEEILTEFAEASRYGKRDIMHDADRSLEYRNHSRNRKHSEYQSKYGKRPEVKLRRKEREREKKNEEKLKRTSYAIVPISIVTFMYCPECGELGEIRPGLKRITDHKCSIRGLETKTKMAEQYKVAIPYEKRVSGWLYDYHSGQCIGIASYEMKERQAAGVPFKADNVAGCTRTIIIHPPTSVALAIIKPNPMKPTSNSAPFSAAKCIEWEYKRREGDITIYAPTKEDAIAAMKDNGIINIDEKHLKPKEKILRDVLLHNEDIS